MGIRSESSDGDVSSNNGGEDFWAVKLNADDVGVDEHPRSAISVFPNPASEGVSLQFDKPITGAIVIYDAAGREVMARSVRGSACSLDLRGLKTGIYSVEVQSGTEVIREQLVVH